MRSKQSRRFGRDIGFYALSIKRVLDQNLDDEKNSSSYMVFPNTGH
jgi:hypothetical protein